MEQFSAYNRETSSINQKDAAYSLELLALSSKLWLQALLCNLKETVDTNAADSFSAPVGTLPMCPVPAGL